MIHFRSVENPQAPSGLLECLILSLLLLSSPLLLLSPPPSFSPPPSSARFGVNQLPAGRSLITDQYLEESKAEKLRRRRLFLLDVRLFRIFLGGVGIYSRKPDVLGRILRRVEYQ